MTAARGGSPNRSSAAARRSFRISAESSSGDITRPAASNECGLPCPITRLNSSATSTAVAVRPSCPAADFPRCIFPFLSMNTIEGVAFCWALSITSISPFRDTEMTELVVPKSIPKSIVTCATANLLSCMQAASRQYQRSSSSTTTTCPHTSRRSPHRTIGRMARLIQGPVPCGLGVPSGSSHDTTSTSNRPVKYA